MFRALYTAASGMDAQQRNIDVTANNIANVNTTGFKASRAEFQELLYQQVRAPGAPQDGGAPVGIEIGLGVRTAATNKSFEQGTLESTENPLDLAIEGSGFFQVRRESGEEAYTRAGVFQVNAYGRVVNQDGHELSPGITVPPDTTAINISRDGRVAAMLPDGGGEVELGRIELHQFTNPAGLQSLGRNLFSQTAASGDAMPSTPGENGVGELSQGFLEGSNVKVVEEMIDMIVSQRAYEINSKVIQTADEMMRSATNLR
ncbi:MAG: flagellar basal-body rod protein FlgG [Bradymonadia bacterium]|jgi:flagellar basal-body rod protein FlgG